MPDLKISELPAAITLSGTEDIPIDQGGVTKRTTTSELVALIPTPVNPNYYVSVADFGAVGDGTTDDTAAIQAAIDSLPTYVENGGGGGVVFFPYGESGIYNVTSSITIDQDGVYLLGLTNQTPIIQGSFSDSIIKTTGLSEAAYLQFITLKSLHIVNNSSNASARALTFNWTSNSTIEDCMFEAKGTYVVYCTNCWTNSYINNFFKGFALAHWDFYLEDNINQTNIIGNRFNSATSGLGVSVSGATYNRAVNIIGNLFENLGVGSTNDEAIDIGNCEGGQITGNYFEDDNCNGIVITNHTTTFGMRIANNWINNYKGTGIYADVSYCEFGNNVFVPGVNDTNANGLYLDNATFCKTFPQKLMSGGGTAYTNHAGTSNSAL